MADLESIQQLLNNLRLNLKNDIKEEINDLKTTFEIKFELIDKNYAEVSNKLEEQTRKLDYLDKEIKKRNLIIYGLIDNEVSHQNLEEKIMHLFNEILNVATKCEELDFIRRIGKREVPNRPILVGLTTLRKKILLLKQTTKLSKTGISIAEDFTKETLEKRKMLLPVMLNLRKDNNHAILRQDKIILNGKPLENPESYLKSSKKRTLSDDDAITSDNKLISNPNPKKANKSKNNPIPKTNTTRGRPRSNSVHKISADTTKSSDIRKQLLSLLDQPGSSSK